MKNKLKVDIIGTGEIANAAHHCPSLAGIEDVIIVAACDTDEKESKRIANKFNIPNTLQKLQKKLLRP